MLIAFRQTLKRAVEPAKKAALGMVLTLGNGLEQCRAQGRRQRQGQERRKQNRGRHRHRELLIDHAHRARHKRHGNEHGHQYQGNADDRPADLRHGLVRGLAWRQAFAEHDPLDVLNHHNRVVHQNPDGQDHAEHGQYVDRETQDQHRGECAHQRDGHHQGRDQRVTDVLQEQEHHREHQHHGFDQGVHHLGDRDFDERRGVIRDLVLNALREVAAQLIHFGADHIAGTQGVRLRCQFDAESARRLAVQAGAVLVLLAADLNPCHIADPDRGTVRVGAQDNIAELLRARQLAFNQHRGGNFLGRAPRQITDAAGRYLRVLAGNRFVDVRRCQVETNEFLRVDPDPHGPFRAILLSLADPFNALDLVHHVARQVVAEGNLIQPAARVCGQRYQHQEARGDFLHLQALLDNGLWQTRLHRFKAVLHVDLSHFRVGTRLERGRNAGTAQTALRLEIQQAVGAVELLLNQADHALVQGMRRRAGVHRIHFNLRRCDHRVFGHGQLRQRQGSGQHNE